MNITESQQECVNVINRNLLSYYLHNLFNPSIFYSNIGRKETILTILKIKAHVCFHLFFVSIKLSSAQTDNIENMY